MVATTEVEDEGSPSVGDRVRAAFAVPAGWLAALVVPDKALPRIVADQRYAGALLASIVCALLAAAAVGSRLDVSRQVLDRYPGGAPAAAGGRDPATMEESKSDREIAEEIVKEGQVAQVKLGLSAALLTPIKVLLLALVVLFIGRYVGGKPTFKTTLPVAAHAALPFGVKSLIGAAAAIRSPVLSPMHLDTLVAPAAIRVAPIFSPVDPFMVWSVILLGFGLAPAAQISRRKAFAAVVACFVLWLMLTNLGGARPS